MANEVIYKRPGEIITFFVDFAGVVASNDTTLATTSVTAVDEAGTVDNTVIASSSSSGTKLTAVLTLGTEGKDYLITYSAKGGTSGNGPWEKTVEMRVRARMGIGNV